MTLGPRLRTGLRRSSLLFWSATLAVAGATGLFVSHQVGEASARAARLGGLRDVPVAARPLAAGRVLRPADVEVRRLPAAAVPDGAVARSPAGRPTLVPLAAGEVLLAAKLAPDGVHGVAALLPAGMKALAVPIEPAALALERGHHVDVLATFDVEVGAGGYAGDSVVAGGGPSAGKSVSPAASGVSGGSSETGGAAGEPGGPANAGAPTFPVATDAVVLDAGEESVTIAVSPEEAPRVAFAIARGTVTLALTGRP